MNKNIVSSIWWGIGTSLLITSGIMKIVAPEFSMFIFGVFLTSCFILSLLLIVNRKSILIFLKTRYFKNVFANIITLVLALLIMAMINYLGFKNSQHIDITKQRIHSLSEQSKEVLKQVNKKLTMTLYARRRHWEKYLNLVNLYKNANKNIHLNVIDIDTNPSLVQLNNIKDDGTIIISYEGKNVSVVAHNELSLTNILIKLFRSRNINIYYTTGHSEIERNLNDQNGGRFLFKKIINSNYNLKSIDLLKVTNIPNDASALIILGPKEGFLDLEISVLERFLNKGGNVLLALSPEFQDQKLKNLYELLLKHGVRFENSIVLDRLATVQGTQATIPIIVNYNTTHSITKKFRGKTLFPLTAALFEAKAKDYITYTALFKTNHFPGSWAETNFKEVSSGKAQFDENDFKGPIDIAVALENTRTTSRMVVTSSSSFIVNGYKSQNSNFNLFLNMLAWVVDDEGIISLNRPELENEMILLSASQVTLIFYLSIVFMPFLFFGIAVYFYRRRLKK